MKDGEVVVTTVSADTIAEAIHRIDHYGVDIVAAIPREET
jgi:hypothetical protein